MPKYFLFGLLRVQMWEWYWGHTTAQIELIDADSPMICYKKQEGGKGGGLKPGDKGYRPDAKKLEETVERWKKRKAAREARGFKLDALLSTGEKIPVEE